VNVAFENILYTSEMGGGLHFSRSSIFQLNQSSFSSCKAASNYGGGAYIGNAQTGSTVFGCYFLNCYANYGGAIYFDSCVEMIDRVVCADCSASRTGGIRCTSGNNSCLAANFTSDYCTDAGWGGALQQLDPGTLGTTNSLFVGCSGGGVVGTADNGQQILETCAFVLNPIGAVIHYAGGSPKTIFSYCYFEGTELGSVKSYGSISIANCSFNASVPPIPEGFTNLEGHLINTQTQLDLGEMPTMCADSGSHIPSLTRSGLAAKTTFKSGPYNAKRVLIKVTAFMMIAMLVG
jgi:hypothetical protein